MSEAKMLELFSLAEHAVDIKKIHSWLADPSDSDYLECEDRELSIFLNGLICGLRGPKEGPPPEPDKKLTNNQVFKKLKIALDLKNEDVIDLFASVGLTLNKYELTGFLRKSEHKNYRSLKRHELKAFLKALELQKLSLESN